MRPVAILNPEHFSEIMGMHGNWRVWTAFVVGKVPAFAG